MNKVTPFVARQQRDPAQIGSNLETAIVQLWQREIAAGKRTVGQSDALSRAAAWAAAGHDERALETVASAAKVKALLAKLTRRDGSLSLTTVLEAAAGDSLAEHPELFYALLDYVRSGDVLRPRVKGARRRR